MNVSEFNPLIRFMDKRRGGVPYTDFVLAYDHRLFFVVSGSVRVFFGDKSANLSEGQSIIIPPALKYKLEYSYDSEYYVINFDFTFSVDRLSIRPTPPDFHNTFKEKNIIANETSDIFPCVLSSDSVSSEHILKMHEIYSKKDFLYNEQLSSYLKLFVTDAFIFTQYDKTPEDMKKILSYLNRHYLDNITNTDIAEVFSFHPNYINRIFKEHTGKTLHSYIIEQRLKKASKLLLSTELPVTSIAEMCAFDSYAYFIKSFKKHYSLPPAQFRRANRRIL